MDAFDADVLIYAASRGHPLGRRVRDLFPADPEHREITSGVGSLLLLPEVLSKPLRERDEDQVESLVALLSHLDLRPIDHATADLATALGSAHRLRAADAAHLATAVLAGCDRFITNNRRDFGPSISEIDVTFPEDLPASP